MALSVDAELALLAELYPRVAIAHDWLSTPGGSEKVVAALLSIVPQAEIFTTVYDPVRYGPPIAARPVHPSFLDRLPGAQHSLPQAPPADERRMEPDGPERI